MNVSEAIVSQNIIFSDFRLLNYINQDMLILEKISEIREIFQYHQKTKIILFDSLKDLSQYVGQELPDWVVGTNDHQCIMLLIYDLWKENNDSSLTQILIHEFVHVIVNEKTLLKRPNWLNEGLALYFAGQIGDFGRVNLIEKNKSLYLMGYDHDNFYELCGLVTERLIETYGVEKIISKLSNKTDYINDDVLGEKNILEIVRDIVKL